MASTYKIFESYYDTNGCQMTEQQVFDDTQDFNQAIIWASSIDCEKELFDARKNCSRHIMSFAVSIQEYIDGEFYHELYFKNFEYYVD